MKGWGKIVPLEEIAYVKVCRQEWNGTIREGVVGINSMEGSSRNGSWKY